jgi:hypothetical protein
MCADLLVVKQTFKGHKDADVTHIENILKREHEQLTHTQTT